MTTTWYGLRPLRCCRLCWTSTVKERAAGQGDRSGLACTSDCRSYISVCFPACAAAFRGCRGFSARHAVAKRQWDTRDLSFLLGLRGTLPACTVAFRGCRGIDARRDQGDKWLRQGSRLAICRGSPVELWARSPGVST